MKKFTSLFLSVVLMALLLTGASGFTTVETKEPLNLPAQETAPGIRKVGTRAGLIALLTNMGVFYSEKESEPSLNSGFALADTTAAVAPAAAPMPSMAPQTESAMDMAGGEGGYSSTNSQVSGIDEGDILKTDGRYIYYVSYNQIAIIKADAGTLQKVGVIALPDDVSVNQIYIDGDTLVTVGSRYESPEPDVTQDDGKISQRSFWIPGKEFTTVSLYDISDRANPTEVRTVQTEGYLNDSRLYDGRLYFVSSKWIYSLPENETDDFYILPVFRDSAQGGGNQYVDPAVIDCPMPVAQASYTYISALSLTGDDPFAPTVVLGAGSTLYMSQTSLYFTQYDYSASTPATQIYRYAIGEGQPVFAATGRVEGTPLNQYAMDEYDEVFRIATTDWQNGNHVHTLDSEMNPLGSLRNLAPGEQIYSVRFMGDIGYVVTFKRVDPLFSIDLSDPENPALLGQLKIPGFSSYLHPYGDNYLIGIGQSMADLYVRDENGEEHVVGQTDMGIKFSLFDISDPKNVKETFTKTVGFQYSHSEALYNPRTIMMDLARGAFALPASLSEIPDANGQRDYFNGYVVMNVSETTGFSEKGRLGGSTSWNARMCYIGNTYYLLSDNAITAYDCTTLAQTGVLHGLTAEPDYGAKPTPVPFIE